MPPPTHHFFLSPAIPLLSGLLSPATAAIPGRNQTGKTSISTCPYQPWPLFLLSVPAHILSCSRVSLAAISGDPQPSALELPWTLLAQDTEAEVSWWISPAPGGCIQPGPSCCSSVQLHRSIFCSAGPGGNKHEVVRGARHGDVTFKRGCHGCSWSSGTGCSSGVSGWTVLEHDSDP